MEKDVIFLQQFKKSITKRYVQNGKQIWKQPEIVIMNSNKK